MSDLSRDITKKIVVNMQCFDFGHTDDEGNFRTTGPKIDLLEKRAAIASADAIKAVLDHLEFNVTPEMLEAGDGWREYDWEMDGLPREVEDVCRMYNGIFRGMINAARKQVEA